MQFQFLCLLLHNHRVLLRTCFSMVWVCSPMIELKSVEMYRTHPLLSSARGCRAEATTRASSATAAAAKAEKTTRGILIAPSQLSFQVDLIETCLHGSLNICLCLLLTLLSLILPEAIVTLYLCSPSLSFAVTMQCIEQKNIFCLKDYFSFGNLYFFLHLGGH